MGGDNWWTWPSSGPMDTDWPDLVVDRAGLVRARIYRSSSLVAF